MKRTVWVIYRKSDGDISYEVFESREKARIALKQTVLDFYNSWRRISKTPPAQLKKLFTKLLEGYSVKKATLTIHA